MGRAAERPDSDRLVRSPIAQERDRSEDDAGAEARVAEARAFMQRLGPGTQHADEDAYHQ